MDLLRRAAAGGVTLFQLRAKGIAEEKLLPRAERLASLCAEINLPLIINDHPRLACRLGAVGVHLGQADGSVAAAREIMGPGFVVGRSTHNISEVSEAVRQGVDYIALGSIYPTASKPGVKPCGTELLRQVLAESRIPVFAIGGINAGNVAELAAEGARRVAVISAIWDAPDPKVAAAQLRGLLKGGK